MKYHNIFLLMRCYVYALLRDKAVRKPKSLTKIIIFTEGKLGDTVCATPVFRAIKNTYKDCRVIIFGAKINAEVLAYNPDVDEYVATDGVSFRDLHKKIQSFKADAALILAPNFPDLAVLFLSGIPFIIVPRVEGGWSPQETRPYKALSRLVYTMPHHMRSYAPREYLRLLEPLGIHTDLTKKYIYSSAKAEEWVRTFYEEKIKPHNRKLVMGMSVGAGNSIKRWGVEKFANLVKEIHDTYSATFVFIGSKADCADTHEVIKRVSTMSKSGIAYIDVSGKINIDELKALMSHLDLFVSVDTGPIYIAEALNVRTVDIVGPVAENEQPPRGERHKVVVPKRERPQLHIMNAREYDPVEAKRQAEAVSVAEVMQAIRELFPVTS